MITFAGTQIRGVHGPVTAGAPTLQVTRTKFQGVIGESEIIGERGGRSIDTHIWLVNLESAYTQSQLVAELERLDSIVGKHGLLRITSVVPSLGVVRDYKHCTFEGFVPDRHGPRVDDAGTLGGGWWCPGVLRWYQLEVI